MKYERSRLLFFFATYKVFYCNCTTIKFTYSEPHKFISMSLNVYAHYQHKPLNRRLKDKCINKQCMDEINHNDFNNTAHIRAFYRLFLAWAFKIWNIVYTFSISKYFDKVQRFDFLLLLPLNIFMLTSQSRISNTNSSSLPWPFFADFTTYSQHNILLLLYYKTHYSQITTCDYIGLPAEQKLLRV